MSNHVRIVIVIARRDVDRLSISGPARQWQLPFGELRHLLFPLPGGEPGLVIALLFPLPGGELHVSPG